MVRTRERLVRPPRPGGITSACRAECHALERRRLLSVSVTFNNVGTLDLTFGAANDVATITSNSAAGDRFIVSGTGFTATTFSNVTGLALSGSTLFRSSATITNQTGDPITLSQSIATVDVNTTFTVSQPVSVRTFVSSGSPITLNVPSITTSANLSFFSSAVTLASDITLTSAGSVTFGSTVNGAHSLAIDNTGPVSFGGAVGGVTRLNNLTIAGPGTTSVGAAISTSGTQQYDFPVTLTADSTLSSSASGPNAITFNSPLDGAFSLTTNGGVQFGGPVGSTTPLAGLTVNASAAGSFQRSGVTTTGNQSYNGEFDLGMTIRPNAFTSTAAGNITFAGPMNGNGMPLTVNTGGITTFGGTMSDLGTVVTDAAGSTRILATIVSNGPQTFNDPITLAGDSNCTSSGGGDITFGRGVDGAFALTLNTLGNINLTHPVGMTTPLAAFSTGLGGTIHANGGSVKTSGSQVYQGPVVLGAAWQATSTGGGNIVFNNTIDGAFDLTVMTDGVTSFHGVIGGTSPPNSIETNSLSSGSGGTLISAGRITTHVDQNYNEAVTLGADCTLNSAAGNIGFDRSVDGAFALTVTTTRQAVIFGQIGGITPLHSFVAHADQGIELAANITTTAGQTYQSALSLDANVTLGSQSSGDITFVSTVDGQPLTHPNLTLNTAGTTTFNASVGADSALGSLTTDAAGSTLLDGANVFAVGAETYLDPVVLGLDTTLAPGQNSFGNFQNAVEFDNTVNGPHVLHVRTNTFAAGAPLGGDTPLAGIDVSAATASLGAGAITTSGFQSFDVQQTTLTADLALSSIGAGVNVISFLGTIDGDHALSVAAGTGNVRFQSVGAITPLTALNILSANNVTGTLVNAGSITQSAGLGTTTFTTLHVTDPAGISLAGTGFALGTLNIDHGSLSVSDAGPASVSGVITAAGGLTKSGAGTLTLALANQYPGLTNVAGGTLEFDKSISLPGGIQNLPGGLHVGAGATAALGNQSISGVELVTTSLTFDGTLAAPQGRLDLFNGELLIDFGNTPDPIAAIGADVSAGFNHGQWNGQGIFSTAAAMNPSGLAVGYADGIDGVVHNLSPGRILLKTTVPGDLNLDGAINFNDLLTLAQHFGQPGTWDKGDLNYDGTVAFPDLLTLAQHFGNTLMTSAASSSARKRLALLR